jgi:SAM-dependent methyltransferase
MSEYSALYKYYDLLMSGYPYGKILKFIEPELRRARVKSCFEFACGTGKMSIALSRLGIGVTASDLSPDMLNAAAESAELNGQKITFVRQDVNKPEISKKYGLIACFTDGFNYVSGIERLNILFGRIYSALNPGGLFIFDVSTLYKAEKILSGELYYEDLDGLTLFWRNSAIKKNAVDMNLTFFERRGEAYFRSDETNRQYFYKNEDIFKALGDNCFEFSAFDGDGLHGLKDDSKRLLIIAEKI